jgi:hypothetical protein
MEVTLVSKLLATLADVILYTLMIMPVVSVILRDRFKITNVTGVFAVVVAWSTLINGQIWIIEMVRWNNMRLIVSSFALFILGTSETIVIFKSSHKH